MAISQPQKIVGNEKDRVLVKYVKKAKMWCKTTFLKGKQTQEWFSERPKDN